MRLIQVKFNLIRSLSYMAYLALCDLGRKNLYKIRFQYQYVFVGLKMHEKGTNKNQYCSLKTS